MARSCPLGFSGTLARSSAMGFSSALARSATLVFSNELARSTFLGWTFDRGHSAELSRSPRVEVLASDGSLDVPGLPSTSSSGRRSLETWLAPQIWFSYQPWLAHRLWVSLL